MDKTINTRLKIIKFKHLSECSDICHSIFARVGGCSSRPFDSLNVGYSTGDNRQNVLKNRQTITEVFGGGENFFINQVHGKQIFVLKKDTITPPEADGVVTNLPGILIFIQVADCQPVILYDPVNKVIANIHSGWKGSLQNIAGAGIDTMKREFKSDPGQILAGIGPSLGPCCSEFVNYEFEIPERFLIYKRGKNHFDFWQMTIDQLVKRGVKADNIELSRICTKCSHDLFFSYRHEKITGRFASVIKIL